MVSTEARSDLGITSFAPSGPMRAPKIRIVGFWPSMLFARFWLAIPVLALAGAFARAKSVPAGSGTLPTHTPLFVVVLISTVITVGALTFVPALALGPVAEHLQLFAAK